MPAVTINNQAYTVKDGTILDALKEVGLSVPTLCNVKDLTPTGACRLCLVEVEGMPGLVTSCSFPIKDGMKIQTHSPRVMAARKTTLELLLSSHPNDCLYCQRNHDCRLKDLVEEYGVERQSFPRHDRNLPVDDSSPSLVRDPNKCILCGRCVRVCEEIQTVSAIDFVHRGAQTVVSPAFQQTLGASSCINCGQCVAACPTGALREKDGIEKVVSALQDPRKHVVIQHAPSVSVAIAEEFGIVGEDVDGQMTAALRQIGFAKVFDTSFSADLTIMEEASEFVERVKSNGVLPMFTSCSPGWVKFLEEFYPEFIPNLSSAKSPQQMLGAVIKSYYAEKNNIDPKTIYSVAVMPCTAKKFECQRPEMGLPDIDVVLTTRELAKLFKRYKLDLNKLTPSAADTPFGDRSTAGKLFGASGGVMEAALRSAYYFLTGTNLKELKFEALRGLEGVKKASVKVNDLEVKVAVVSGLGNARKMLDAIKEGKEVIHFMEVMTCPGGCINGGGQPIDLDKVAVKKRMQKLYQIDAEEKLRLCHENPSIKRIYDEYLGKPLGHKSHELLHTHYTKRDVIK